MLYVHIDERTEFFVPLLDHIRIFEVGQQLGSPLNPGVANLADLLRVKFLPFFKVELLIKVSNKFCVDEVYKGITHVALILNKSAITL